MVADSLPRSVAPNTVTLVGLLFSLFSSILTLLFNPSLGPEGPRWLHLVAGICLFVYQTLDNVDGQQARRTGTSSPLGMLFDHGCDAINSIISLFSLSSVFGVGWTGGLFLALFAGYVPFYIQTWEEYYLEEMSLPVVNGPTEGLLVVMVASIISFWVGAHYWQTPIDGKSLPNYFCDTVLSNDFIQFPSLQSAMCVDTTPFVVLCFATVFAVFATFFFQFFNIVRKVAEREGSADLYGLFKTMIRLSFDLLPASSFFVCCLLWLSFSREALHDYPIVSLLFIGVVFVENVTQLMIDHICKTPVTVTQRLLILPILLLTLNTTSFVFQFNEMKFVSRSFTEGHGKHWDLISWHLGALNGSICADYVTPLVPERYVVYPLFVLTFLRLVVKIYRVVEEAAEALGIYVFRTDKKTLMTKEEIRRHDPCICM